MKNLMTLRVSHRYTRLPDASLSTFARSVLVGMTNNPAFPNPLVPLTELSALQSDFAAKLAASTGGGRALTAAKNKAREALTAGLRRQGLYVQGVARDLTELLSSGYWAASRNTAQTQLTKPVIQKILNEYSGQLTLRVSPVANARNYQVQIQVDDGSWQEVGFFNQARRIVVANLTPGTVYNLRVRALGGSTGTSDWSPVTSRMARIMMDFRVDRFCRAEMLLRMARNRNDVGLDRQSLRP